MKANSQMSAWAKALMNPSAVTSVRWRSTCRTIRRIDSVMMEATTKQIAPQKRAPGRVEGLSRSPAVKDALAMGARTKMGSRMEGPDDHQPPHIRLHAPGTPCCWTPPDTRCGITSKRYVQPVQAAAVAACRPGLGGLILQVELTQHLVQWRAEGEDGELRLQAGFHQPVVLRLAPLIRGQEVPDLRCYIGLREELHAVGDDRTFAWLKPLPDEGGPERTCTLCVVDMNGSTFT